MNIWKEGSNGLQMGINDDGDLFLGDDESGYNLSDTPENREQLRSDFEYYNKERKSNGKY